MRILSTLVLLTVSCALPATASAQFSVFGPGSQIPVLGDGGDVAVNDDGLAVYDTTMPGFYASSTVSVPQAVVQVDSVRIDGFEHSWAGDIQATLVDPVGVEHLLFVRPGYLNTSAFGTSGSFLNGSFTFVESGGLSLPTVSDSINIPPGTYNQTFDTGGTTWVSGTNSINNTPLSSLSGPAGTWELRIYDWSNGDFGQFSGWTLNGNNFARNSGVGYCFGDGTGAACPCGALGGPGTGCMSTSGTGATLVATGDANTANDSLQFLVTGAPANKNGLFFQGVNPIANLVGDGILCALPTKRYALNPTDSFGAATQTGFGAFALPGQTIRYQYWYRDPTNPCTARFNFTGGWVVTWQ